MFVRRLKTKFVSRFWTSRSITNTSFKVRPSNNKFDPIEASSVLFSLKIVRRWFSRRASRNLCFICREVYCRSLSVWFIRIRVAAVHHWFISSLRFDRWKFDGSRWYSSVSLLSCVPVIASILFVCRRRTARQSNDFIKPWFFRTAGLCSRTFSIWTEVLRRTSFSSNKTFSFFHWRLFVSLVQVDLLHSSTNRTTNRWSTDVLVEKIVFDEWPQLFNRTTEEKQSSTIFSSFCLAESCFLFELQKFSGDDASLIKQGRRLVGELFVDQHRQMILYPRNFALFGSFDDQNRLESSSTMIKVRKETNSRRTFKSAFKRNFV